MANSNRRYLDKQGNMFMPMDVEGGYQDGRFFNTTKFIALICIAATALVIYFALVDTGTVRQYLVLYTLWFIASVQVIRYIIFEEKYYYRMYLQLKDNKVTTPAAFWNVTSTNDTEDGVVLTFVDARIGIILKLDRDTITGKEENFRERHYDAISDFYRELVTMGYSMVQMNIMEQAGNDPRLPELDRLVNKDPNPNIRKLLEASAGHIKNITNRTLYESDYFMIYTHDISKIDMLFSDAIDAVYKILDGGYIGYHFLSLREVVDLVKEQYNVSFFDANEATITMSKNNGYDIAAPFTLVGMEFNDGVYEEVGRRELFEINRITSGVNNGSLDIGQVSFRKAFKKKENKKDNLGVDFSGLSSGLAGETNPAENVSRRRGQAKVQRSQPRRPQGQIPQGRQGQKPAPQAPQGQTGNRKSAPQENRRKPPQRPKAPQKLGTEQTNSGQNILGLSADDFSDYES